MTKGQRPSGEVENKIHKVFKVPGAFINIGRGSDESLGWSRGGK